MGKKKYVAIYENEAFIFDTWASCKEFVSDKKNILYKGFLDPEENDKAKEYINANVKTVLPFDIPDVLYAYVDGSYRKVKNEEYIGYGYVFVKNLKEIANGNGRVENVTKSMNQVNGELKAILEATKRAIDEGYERIVVVYDFIGIEAWTNGSWKIKDAYIQEYVDKINEYKKQITIDMIKVDSHQTKANKKIENIFNDRADELAQMCWRTK